MPEICCTNANNLNWDIAVPGIFNVAHDVHIWRTNIPANLHLLHFFKSILIERELERSHSYQNDTDKFRFIVTRALLRILLGQYMGRNPVEIKFETGHNGKPYVHLGNNTGIHFNVSHSGDLALIAVSNLEVGVDVEKTDDNFIFTQMLQQYFSIAQRYFINNSEDPRANFYQLWTRKEALIKGAGNGVDIDLTLIPCLDGFQKVAPEIINSTENWHVCSFDMAKQYTGCVAYNSAIQNISFLETTDLYKKLGHSIK